MSGAMPAGNQEPEADTSMPGTTDQSSSRPAAKFSGSGGLHVAVWKHKSEQGYDRYSVRVERTYKDGDGYQSTDYLRDADLLRVRKLLDDADNWIEQDKAKFRASASQEQGQGR